MAKASIALLIALLGGYALGQFGLEASVAWGIATGIVWRCCEGNVQHRIEEPEKPSLEFITDGVCEKE